MTARVPRGTTPSLPQGGKSMTDQNTIIVNPSATQAFETLWKCSCTVEKHKAKQGQPALPLFRSQGNAIEKFIAVCYT